MRVVVFTILLLMLLGCGEAPPAVISGDAMGARYHVTVMGESSRRGGLAEEIVALIESIEQEASQWRGRSWVSRFNASQAGTPLPVPPHVSSMLLEARQGHAQTQGAFDVTAGPLVELWGFGAVPRSGDPSEMQIAEALVRCGFDKLALNDAATVVVKGAPGVQLDFSGLAKGYTIDQVAALLSAKGIEHYLIAFGGEVRASGNGPSGDGWVVGVEGHEAQTITLRDQACATSGTSERNLELEDGQVVSHLIDPRTGRPIAAPSRAVTVIADRGVLADLWATTLAVDQSESMVEAAGRAGVEWLSE